MMVMASANDLISLYLGLELQSLAAYVIAAFHRLRMNPGSEPLTAFRTRLGAFE